jgi:protein SCO1/2
MKTRLLLIALIVVLSSTLIFLIAFWEPLPPATIAAAPPPARLAAAAKPAGGNFTLQGPQGPVTLADYRGKVVVLYFGYTYCPDVCPTSLALIAQGPVRARNHRAAAGTSLVHLGRPATR